MIFTDAGRIIIKNFERGVKTSRKAYYDTVSSSEWNHGDIIISWEAIDVVKDQYIYPLDAVCGITVDSWSDNLPINDPILPEGREHTHIIQIEGNAPRHPVSQGWHEIVPNWGHGRTTRIPSERPLRRRTQLESEIDSSYIEALQATVLASVGVGGIEPGKLPFAPESESDTDIDTLIKEVKGLIE